MSSRSLATPDITAYERRHRQATHDLIFRSYRVHSHLDWQESEAWLESNDHPARLAWIGDRLVGVMAASAPLNGACWLRLVVVSDFGDAGRIIAALWQTMKEHLRERGVRTVAVLVSRDWLLSYLRALTFRPEENIVTLERDRQPLPPQVQADSFILRLIYPHEIDALTAVDHTAFDPPWQMEKTDIRQAEKISSVATAALCDGEIIGYSLYTVYIDGAHLARLAVMPRAQGRGIASALLADALHRFARRSIFTMTVNTQASNIRSLRLYERFGFVRNGYDLPVWVYDLN
ncbi:MAG: GNAT family N-acetyltransferase [Chloroflexi bacterium]|nr:GNAT family N-acetyltransferase [Chloroflexota bacterium]